MWAARIEVWAYRNRMCTDCQVLIIQEGPGESAIGGRPANPLEAWRKANDHPFDVLMRYNLKRFSASVTQMDD